MGPPVENSSSAALAFWVPCTFWNWSCRLQGVRRQIADVACHWSRVWTASRMSKPRSRGSTGPSNPGRCPRRRCESAAHRTCRRCSGRPRSRSARAGQGHGEVRGGNPSQSRAARVAGPYLHTGLVDEHLEVVAWLSCVNSCGSVPGCSHRPSTGAGSARSCWSKRSRSTVMPPWPQGQATEKPTLLRATLAMPGCRLLVGRRYGLVGYREGGPGSMRALRVVADVEVDRAGSDRQSRTAGVGYMARMAVASPSLTDSASSPLQSLDVAWGAHGDGRPASVELRRPASCRSAPASDCRLGSHAKRPTPRRGPGRLSGVRRRVGLGRVEGVAERCACGRPQAVAASTAGRVAIDCRPSAAGGPAIVATGTTLGHSARRTPPRVVPWRRWPAR